MKQKLFFIFILSCSFLLCFSGCIDQEGKINPDITISNETKILHLMEVPQETDLLYLGREGDYDYFIDPVLPQQPMKVAVDKRASNFLNKIKPFTLIQLIADTNHSQGIAQMRLSSVSSINTHDFCAIKTLPNLTADNEKQIGKEFLDSFLYTRIFPEFAISSYQLLEASLEPLDNENHMFALTLTANLTPEQTEFHYLGHKWSSYTEGTLTIPRQQIKTILYYYDGIWGCYYDPEYQVPLVEGYLKNPPLPQSPYTSEETENILDALFNGETVEQIFYEDGLFSYLAHSIFVITDKSEDGSLIESGYFRTWLYQYDRENDIQKELLLLEDDLLEPKVLGRSLNTLYLHTNQIHYPSGSMPAHLLQLDLESGISEILFRNVTPFLVTNSHIYLLQLSENELHPAGIYKIEFYSGSFERLCDLPGNAYSPLYETMILARKTEKDGIEYLHLLWPNSDYTKKDFHQAYCINTETGEIFPQ